jgi:hypothetical protein
MRWSKFCISAPKLFFLTQNMLVRVVTWTSDLRLIRRYHYQLSQVAFLVSIIITTWYLWIAPYQTTMRIQILDIQMPERLDYWTHQLSENKWLSHLKTWLIGLLLQWYSDPLCILFDTCLMRFPHTERRFPHCDSRSPNFQNEDKREQGLAACETSLATCEQSGKAKSWKKLCV